VGPVEHLGQQRRVAAARVLGLDRAQHVVEEEADLLRDDPLLLFGPDRRGCAPVRRADEHQPADDRDAGCRGRGGGERVPAQQHREGVPGRARAGEKRALGAEPADVLDQTLHARVAVGGVLADRRAHDVVEIAAQAGRPAARGGVGGRGVAREGGAGLADGALHLFARAADAVGARAGDHLVEQEAEAVHVRRLADLAPPDLFGRRVLGREGAVPGERGALVGVAEQFGDAEVEEARGAVAGHEDVRGLQVPVDDHVGVRVAHGVGDRLEEGEPGVEAEPLEGAVETFALDMLHGEVGAPVVGEAPVEEARDRGVLELREQAALDAEPLAGLGGREVPREDLDRDGLVVQAVGAAGAVDDAHPPRGDGLDDLVDAEAGAEERIGLVGVGRRREGFGRVVLEEDGPGVDALQRFRERERLGGARERLAEPGGSLSLGRVGAVVEGAEHPLPGLVARVHVVVTHADPLVRRCSAGGGARRGRNPTLV
jgi:hypothetical protein